MFLLTVYNILVGLRHMAIGCSCLGTWVPTTSTAGWQKPRSSRRRLLEDAASALLVSCSIWKWEHWGTFTSLLQRSQKTNYIKQNHGRQALRLLPIFLTCPENLSRALGRRTAQPVPMFWLPLPAVLCFSLNAKSVDTWCIHHHSIPCILPLRVKPLGVSSSTLRAPGKAYLLAHSCPCRGEDELYKKSALFDWKWSRESPMQPFCCCCRCCCCGPLKHWLKSTTSRINIKGSLLPRLNVFRFRWCNIMQGYSHGTSNCELQVANVM